MKSPQVHVTFTGDFIVTTPNLAPETVAEIKRKSEEFLRGAIQKHGIAAKGMKVPRNGEPDVSVLVRPFAPPTRVTEP